MAWIQNSAKTEETKLLWISSELQKMFVQILKRANSITSFSIGSISRWNLGAESSGTDEDGESQSARDNAAVLLLSRLLLLGTADEQLPGLGRGHLAWGRRWSCGSGGGEGVVVKETRSGSHYWSLAWACKWVRMVIVKCNGELGSGYRIMLRDLCVCMCVEENGWSLDWGRRRRKGWDYWFLDKVL